MAPGKWTRKHFVVMVYAACSPEGRQRYRELLTALDVNLYAQMVESFDRIDLGQGVGW